MSELPLLYKDNSLVLINKPHGLLVHRSPIARDVQEFAVQRLRDQLGQHVYPTHRLDRKTSGVLLFALDQAVNSALQKQFSNGDVTKRYHAIVRGYTEDVFDIDYPLRRDDGVVQEAYTHGKILARTEISLALGKHSTSRYSLVELTPATGRMHQLRKHMAHVFHPIIGDRPHGCNKQNRFFKEYFGFTTMLLHAVEIEFTHPVSGIRMHIVAPYSPEFSRMVHALSFILPNQKVRSLTS